jgi:septal ring factor EnvC (AmiA/AmiB activator)
VNKFLVILFVLGCFSVQAQKGSDRLKNEQKKLEKQIATTKSLFEASKQKADLSLEEVRLIDQQVKFREQLLTNIDNQIKAAELKIKQKRQRIEELENDIASLKKQYADLLLYAYKMRSKYGKMMYIFSAESIEEAMKRKLYLEKLAEIQQKQLRLIRQNMELMDAEIKELETVLENQLVLADLKRKERAEILVAKEEKERIYQGLKSKEQEILAELREQEQKNIVLQQQIQAEIQREIKAEQARIEKARKEAEAKRKAEEAKRKATGVVATVEPKKEDVPSPFLDTKESTLAGNNFVINKGKLPWPVEKGTITVNYGKNAHPTLPNVYTQNNGIDISTPKNAVVRSIFDGEVTSVINIPGAGKVVIIKHGNYRSVYSNLQDVYVTKGAKVKTKTPVGSLLPTKDGNISVAHFEIHEVKDGLVNQLNPNLWMSK